jgi:hypothetical protein
MVMTVMEWFISITWLTWFIGVTKEDAPAAEGVSLVEFNLRKLKVETKSEAKYKHFC